MLLQYINWWNNQNRNMRSCSPPVKPQQKLPYGLCLDCQCQLGEMDDDPNGEHNTSCARCRAEQDHDFDLEPDVWFDRYGHIHAL
jgi:hypothetical protein